jgi:hypothetical protein
MSRFIVRVLLVAFAASFLLANAPAALAAQKRPILTGRPIEDIENAVDQGKQQVQQQQAASAASLRTQLLTALAKPFQDLVNIIGDDVANAIAESTIVPAIQDGHGQQCWIALRNFSSVAKAHPLPLTGQAATDLEALRLYGIATNQLCANVHCTQTFSDFKSMAQAVAANTAGPLGTQVVNGLPSLQDVCSKVPQIALVDPILPVPPAPDIKPTGTGNQPAAPAPAPTTPQ